LLTRKGCFGNLGHGSIYACIFSISAHDTLILMQNLLLAVALIVMSTIALQPKRTALSGKPIVFLNGISVKFADEGRI